MKTFFITLVIAGSAFFASAPFADARPRGEAVYVTSHDRHGSGYRHHHHSHTRYRTERYIVGHDRWGRPIWATRTVAIRPSPGRCREVVTHCPPPIRHPRGSGVSITAVFRR